MGNENEQRDNGEGLDTKFSPEEIKIADAVLMADGRTAVVKDYQEGIGYVLTKRDCGNYEYSFSFQTIHRASRRHTL